MFNSFLNVLFTVKSSDVHAIYNDRINYLWLSLSKIKEKMSNLPIKKHAVNVNIYLFVWVIYYINKSKYFSFEEQIYYTVYWIK